MDGSREKTVREDGGQRRGRGWIFNLQAPVPLRVDISLIAPPRTGDRSRPQTVNKWSAKRRPKSVASHPSLAPSLFLFVNRRKDNVFSVVPANFARHILILAVNWLQRRFRHCGKEAKVEMEKISEGEGGSRETGRTTVFSATWNADYVWINTDDDHALARKRVDLVTRAEQDRRGIRQVEESLRIRLTIGSATR